MKPIVARITGEPKDRHYPTFVTLTSEDIPLPYPESWVLLHDLYAIRESRLVEYVGMLDVQKMVEVERCLRYTFDIETPADVEARTT